MEEFLAASRLVKKTWMPSRDHSGAVASKVTAVSGPRRFAFNSKSMAVFVEPMEAETASRSELAGLVRIEIAEVAPIWNPVLKISRRSMEDGGLSVLRK